MGGGPPEFRAVGQCVSLFSAPGEVKDTLPSITLEGEQKNNTRSGEEGHK